MDTTPIDDGRSFRLPGATFTTLSSPRLGARENAVWRVCVAPGEPGAPHRISREETFVAVQGRAILLVDGVAHTLEAGAALAVPAGSRLSLRNPGPGPFEAIAVFLVGGEVALDGQPPFCPPWAA